MSIFEFKGVVSGGILGQPLGVAQFHVDGDNLVLASDSAMGAVTIDLHQGSLAQSSNAYAILPGSGTQNVTWGAQQIGLSSKDLQAVLAEPSGNSLTIYAENSGAVADGFEAVAFQIGANTYVALAALNGNGVATYQVNNTGNLTEASFHSGGHQSYTDAPSAIAVVNGNSGPTLVIASATNNSVTSFAVSNDGALIPASTLGVDQYLPIDTPQDLASISILGQDFVIVASAGTSSLTVLEVAADGALTAADQIMDSLGTRLQGVTLVEAFSIGDHAFILAAGQDSGISLFGVGPSGQLVHLDTVVDEIDIPIETISDMQVMKVGDEIQLFTTSGSEAGMAQFTLDLGRLGVVKNIQNDSTSGTKDRDFLVADDHGRTVDGRGGNDILVDGLGVDTLTGGTGADIFVFQADGKADTITDFEIGKDSLDLTGLGIYRSVDQLTVTTTANGAKLQFGSEVIHIQTANGATLNSDDFTNANTMNADHVDLSYVLAAEDDFSPSTPATLSEINTSFPIAATGYAGDISGGAGDDILAGNGSAQTLSGGAGQDVLRGGDGGDTLFGGDGIDLADYADADAGVTVHLSDPSQNTGFAAGDSFIDMEGITGSAFDDILTGGTDGNVIFGETGEDVLRGLEGDDRLIGGGGNDWIDGGLGNDTLNGGWGDDAILGREGDDVVYAGGGHDNVALHGGDDLVFGGGGNDQLGGSFGDDRMFGGSGDDTIGSGAQDDYINAGTGDDVASGGWGMDEVIGGQGNDTLAGSYGDDIVRGSAGNDSIGGGAGVDYMYGGDDDDLIGAGDDDDFVFGGSGNDFLGGGAGNDFLSGDDGDDKFNGGTGNDTFTGGVGSDLYVFNEFSLGEIDIITDFESGEDQLRLRKVEGHFDGLEIANITMDGAEYTTISYDGHQILLANTDAAMITADDFVFLG